MQKQLILVVVIAVAVMVLSIMPASAQKTKPPSQSQSEIEALKKEIVRLQSELDACKKAKDEAANAATNTRRSDAIASLNAVRSALGTGANLQEFKKYQIESRIKVDALPNTPENLIIKYISDLYRDAVTWNMIGLSGKITHDELVAAATKYGDDADFKKTIGDANHTDFMKHMSYMRPNILPRGSDHDLNCIYAKFISGVLVIAADAKCSDLK